MSQHDDAIDAVLNALGNAEPSASFEARMHHALQQGATPRRTWSMPWMLITAVSMLLCGVALVLGIYVHRPGKDLTMAKPVLLISPTVTPLVTQEVPVHHPAARPRTAKLVRVNVPLNTEEDVATTHQNMPPTPLPLTQEERLVLRMMRHNDLPQLAALSSEARAHSLHDDAEEYRIFFAPRPPLNGQPYYDQHIISGGSQ